MNKLVLNLAIVSALGLSACDSETIKEVQADVAQDNTVFTAPARVIFDPSNGVLSVPNDLLFSDTLDGTLNIPGLVDPTDGGDPFVALNALDGWSTANPFVLDIEFPAGTSLDGNSVFNPASVRIFEVAMGQDPRCTNDQLDRSQACTVLAELVYTQDFITQKSGNAVAVVPLRPLKPATNYLLAMTNNLQDDTGRAIEGSISYDLVRQDITTKPLGSDAQLGLQLVINSYENVIVDAGVDKDSIIYTMAMTTQSTNTVLNTVKSMMVGNLQQGVYPTIGVQDTGASVANILAGVIPDSLVPLYSTANFMQGSITLPYYLGVPSAENPMAPVNDWWKSLCDSGAMLAGLATANPGAIPADPVSVSDGTCVAISQAAGLPAPGLRDLSSLFPLDTDRHLTKYSPVPAPNAMMPLAVQMTTPDVAVANAVRAGLMLPPLEEPAAGWPVVIMQHGITSKKEDMLAMTGILSLYGLATVAIDHPLHGSRGFDLTGDGNDEINASTVSATHYMNLASLLTTRDNLRQSTADILGLRFGLNFLGGSHIEGNPIKIDGTKVHFLGHSLGAITGLNFMSLANTSLNPAIDGMFKVATNVQAMPGVMVATLLLESGAFGDVIKSSLTYAQLPDFTAFVDANFPDGASEAELVGTYQQFYASLDASQQGELNGLFSQFAFAAQTVTDAGDPINYVGELAATQTPTYLIEVVGNGSDNLPDQVIPNTVSVAPLSGTEAAIALLGLPGISETTQDAELTVSGAGRYVFGHHSSILSPSPRAEAPDAVMTGKATAEMQSQVANFFSSMGHLITVQDTDVIH